MTSIQRARGAIKTDMLRDALTKYDRQAVESVMFVVPDMFRRTLIVDLPPLYLDIMAMAGNGAAKRLNEQLASLRTNARKKSVAVEEPPTGEDVTRFFKIRFDKENPKAVQWAQTHAGELIDDISATTRNEIRDIISTAFVAGFDIDEMTNMLTDVVGDVSRAEMIARTETLRASNEGQSQLWDQATEQGLLTGDEQKEWIVTPDDRLCPYCEPMDGINVGLNDEFDTELGSVQEPPLHPNCRCTVGLSIA